MQFHFCALVRFDYANDIHLQLNHCHLTFTVFFHLNHFFFLVFDDPFPSPTVLPQQAMVIGSANSLLQVIGLDTEAPTVPHTNHVLLSSCKSPGQGTHCCNYIIIMFRLPLWSLVIFACVAYVAPRPLSLYFLLKLGRILPPVHFCTPTRLVAYKLHATRRSCTYSHNTRPSTHIAKHRIHAQCNFNNFSTHNNSISTAQKPLCHCTWFCLRFYSYLHFLPPFCLKNLIVKLHKNSFTRLVSTAFLLSLRAYNERAFVGKCFLIA